MTGGTPPHLPPVPSEAFVNTQDKVGALGMCFVKIDWATDQRKKQRRWQKSATDVPKSLFVLWWNSLHIFLSLFGPRRHTVNTNTAEVNKFPKLAMDLCALGKPWPILTLDSVSPGFQLVAASAAHTHSLRIHTHRHRRPHCMQKQHRKWRAYKRSELKECRADGPGCFYLRQTWPFLACVFVCVCDCWVPTKAVGVIQWGSACWICRNQCDYPSAIAN